MFFDRMIMNRSRVPRQSVEQPQFGYQLAQMPQLPQTQGTSYNPVFAQLVRQVQMQQQQQPVGGNYMFGQSFIQPQQTQQTQLPRFDYTRAMMGRRF